VADVAVRPRRLWPLNLGIALAPLYVGFAWLLSRGNDWGFFDSVEYFLTLVPATVAEVVAWPVAAIVALLGAVPTDAVLEGTRGAVFWIVAVLALPLLALMMAYDGSGLLVAVGAVVGLVMVAPLALLCLALLIELVSSLVVAPGWWSVVVLLVIAAYAAYVVVAHRLLKRHFA
jgi:hypothetical protein